MTRNGIIVVNNAKTNTLLFHAVHTLWLEYAGWENQINALSLILSTMQRTTFQGPAKTQISHLLSALTKWWMIMMLMMMMIASKGVADDVYWQDGVEHLELSVQWFPDLQVTNRLDATN